MKLFGTATYEIDGISYSTDLIARNNVEKSSFIQILFRAMLIILILFILYCLLNSIKNKGNIKNKKYKKRTKKTIYITRFK